MAQGEISLEHQVRMYRRAAFATNTKTAYSCQLKKYLSFCEQYGFQPLPADNNIICQYVAFLAQSMCYTSVRQYLNVIRILHMENGYSNPLQDNYAVNSVLKGVQRMKGNYVKRKLPITLDILESISKVLDFTKSQDLAFWAACLPGPAS